MAVRFLFCVSLLVPPLAASPSVYFPPLVGKASTTPYPLHPSAHPQPSYKTYKTYKVSSTSARLSTPNPQSLFPFSRTPSPRSTSKAPSLIRPPTPRPQTTPHHPSLFLNTQPTYYLAGVYPSDPTHIYLPHSPSHPVYPSHLVYSLEPALTPYQSGHHVPAVPSCAANTTKPWCLEDAQYPTYDIMYAAEYHYGNLLSIYTDVADLSTELSVERSHTLEEESYLCPSSTAYVRPLRAQNTDGKWRIIVNGIRVHYETLTQTTRVEECLTSGDSCPLVPQCYQSKCVQKSMYHRLLVYDPYDRYFPFAVESFKLPASCACLMGA